MSSSMEEKASTSQASPSPTSPFAGRLDDASIELLYNELKAKDSDTLTRRSIGNSLLKVYQDLAPTPKPYHLIYPGREKEWSIFVESLFPKGSDSDALYSRQQFRALVHSWNLPSVGKVPIVVGYAKKGWDRNAHGSSFHRFFEQLRARFSTNKYRYIFILVVLCLQLSLALWQFFRFFNDRSARAAFGTGLLIAKAASGALYPTTALMILSMSRWTQHFLRQSKHLRRFLDWEYARSFHIKMACLTFLFGIIHSIAHLAGSYRHGLRHPEALAFQLSRDMTKPIPKSYLDFIKWRASWTGLVSLGIFIIISLCGLPGIRKRYFELFQWTHLLMYPLFVMLLVHGSSAILNKPMLGWWLLLPILLVVTEKSYRFYRIFIPLQVTVILAEDNMVALSIKVRNKLSRFRPGQYIYLRIPIISQLQWHPFTVSKITSDSIVIHIRTTAGNWTSSLWQLTLKSKTFVATMEGPYGSPSREFYRYDNTIIFGAGIGITPFSAILFDLFDKINDNKSPWEKDNKSVRQYLKSQEHQKETTTTTTTTTTINDNATADPRSDPHSDPRPPSPHMEAERKSESITHLSPLKAILQKRSISLHWTVKSSQDLQWLSLLLNQLSSNLSVKINIHLYVTQSDKDRNMSTLLFRSLLDHHRVDSLQTTSALTGLNQTCHFGRPDLEAILDDYHKAYCFMDIRNRPRKIGVIFCGPVILSRLLSRKCQYLTSQARAESARLRYYYHSESF